MNILNQIAACEFPIDLLGDRINSITKVPALCAEIGSVIKLASSSCREGISLLTQPRSPDVRMALRCTQLPGWECVCVCVGQGVLLP